MPPSNTAPKEVKVTKVCTETKETPIIYARHKQIRTLLSMAFIVLAYILFRILTLTHQDNSGFIIPFKWHKGFDRNVRWEYDHGIDYVKTTRPIIIAHRGHSGALPEETVEAYHMAVAAGADIIECDACLTKDLHIVCAHESWISKTTNIAEIFEISRKSEYFVPDENGGRRIYDYFTMDFTLEELKNLTKVEPRLYRNQNNNKKFKIATLDEMIQVAKNADRPVGIHVEIKDPAMVNEVSTGLKEAEKRFEDVVLEILHRNGYYKMNSPCFIQSFDEESLKYVSSISRLPLILLIEYPGNVSEQHLKEVAAYAYGIGPDKNHLVQVNRTTNSIASYSNLAQVAHKNGLRLHIFTFRNEHEFLPWDYRQDPYNEYANFFRLGIDGYFTDFPDTLKNFLDVVYLSKQHNSSGTIFVCSQWLLCLMFRFVSLW